MVAGCRVLLQEKLSSPGGSVPGSLPASGGSEARSAGGRSLLLIVSGLF